MVRRPNLEDITTARLWAEKNAGEDNPLDVFEWKLLELWSAWHGDTAGWHERKQTEGEARMAELEASFKVEGPTEDLF